MKRLILSSIPQDTLQLRWVVPTGPSSDALRISVSTQSNLLGDYVSCAKTMYVWSKRIFVIINPGFIFPFCPFIFVTSVQSFTNTSAALSSWNFETLAFHLANHSQWKYLVPMYKQNTTKLFTVNRWLKGTGLWNCFKCIKHLKSGTDLFYVSMHSDCRNSICLVPAHE